MPVKVAYITHQFPRVFNTYISNELACLAAREIDFEIISLFNWDEPFTQKNVVDAGLLDRVRYLESFPDTDSSCADYPELGALTKKIQPVADYLSENSFDLIHSAFGNRPATFGMLVSKSSGIPFTFETHAFDLFVDFPYAVQKGEHAVAVRTESESNRRYLLDRLGFDPEKVHVIHLSPDLQAVEKIESQETSQLRIISVCRLHPIKGLDIALRAFAEVSAAFPECTYQIVGGGEERGALEKLVTELDLTDRVVFGGEIQNSEALETIANSSLFLLPARIAENGDRDGTPTAIAEALALGVSVVSSQISGIPELVLHRENGILCQPEDIGAFAAALSELLGNERLRKSYGMHGKQWVREQFNVRSNVDKLLALWEAGAKR